MLVGGSPATPSGGRRVDVGSRSSLDDHVVDSFVGRHRELALLRDTLDPDGPLVTFVHGVPGVGTTALLERFAVDARRAGAAVVAIDCRSLAPTPGAVRDALAPLLAGSTGREAEGTGDARVPDDRRTVVLLDHWEAFRLLDAWFRLELVPDLPASSALVIASERPPSPSWRASPARGAAVRSLHLDVLPRDEALELLEQHGIVGDDAERILVRTRALPLALQVAAASGVRPAPSDDVDLAGVAAIWGEAHLASLRPALRRAVEAIAVARRGTAALLAALPEDEPGLLDELAALPFVRLEDDGLAVHPAIRAAIAGGLRAVDPQRHRAYRRAAWSVAEPALRDRSDAAASWRPIADLLHLVDHPLLHDAIFPASGPSPVIEPAAPTDLAAVAALAEGWLPATTAGAIASAARLGVGELHVARDGVDVVGASLLLERTSLASAPLRDEPTIVAVREHLRADPVPPTQEVLVVPVVLSSGLGSWPDDIAAALWLDMKRTYLERRDRLRRVYAAVDDLDGFLAAGAPLGFREAVSPVVVDDRERHVAMLDLGAGGVDGWISWLVAQQLGSSQEALHLDTGRRTAVVRGREVALSRLEFGLLEVLVARGGGAVTRQELIRSVWGHDYTGGSNVVDAVVRTLRRKLGSAGGAVVALRGVGYRYDAAALHPATPTDAVPRTGTSGPGGPGTVEAGS